MNNNAGDAGGGGGGGEGGNQVVEFVDEDGAVFPVSNIEHATLEDLHSVVEAFPNAVRATAVANGWTLLHYAVHLGLADDIARYLLEAWSGAARHRAHNGGPLPLHLVNRRTLGSVAVLVAQQWPEALQLSYDPPEEGNTPFHCAIKNGAPLRVVVAMFLLRYDVVASEGWLNRMLFMAVDFEERFRTLEEHLQAFSRESTVQDGDLALYLALQARAEVPVVRFLDWAWPASIQARYGNGGTPLHFALLNGASHEVVTLLVKSRPEAVLERDDYGCLPIHYVRNFTTRWPGLIAVSWPDAAQVLFMLYPESLQQANHAGELPLHVAAQSNALPLVQFYVEQFPLGLQHKANDGMLPLHKAAQAAQPEGEQVVPYLLQQWPDSVRETTMDGNTVLHHAVVGRGGAALVNLLLSLDPTLLHATSNDGALALHYAAKYLEDLGLFRSLIELMNPEAVRAATNEGYTALHLVACHRNRELCAGLASILVEHAPDLVNSQARDGQLPIHSAALAGPLALVQFFAGSWPELLQSVDHDGLTALHCASLSQPPEVLRYLTDLWPQALQIACADGALPLHHAALRQSSLPSVHALVEMWRGALGVRTTDGLGYLPLHVAVAHRDFLQTDPPLEIVQYLAEASPESLRVRAASGALPVELAARCDAPLDVIFLLLRKWPECVLPRRRSDAV